MAGTACARQVFVVYGAVARWGSVCLGCCCLLLASHLHCMRVIWVPQCVFTS